MQVATSKKCSKCKQEFPISQELNDSGFHAKERSKSGRILRWQSRCKGCQNEANLKYRREKLGQKPVQKLSDEELRRRRNAYNKWYRENVMTEEQKQAHRDAQKFSYRMKNGENINRSKINHTIQPDAKKIFADDYVGERVDGTLFFEWLEGFVREKGLIEASKILELNDSRIAKLIRGGQEKVTIELIDRCLTKADSGTQLWELLPGENEIVCDGEENLAMM